MNIDKYHKALALRSTLKIIQQISWDLNQVEKTYPFYEVKDDKTLDTLITIYDELINRVNSLIKNE